MARGPDFALPPQPVGTTPDEHETLRAIEISVRQAAMVELPPFSLPGPVSLAASGRYHPAIARRVVEVVASLSTAGTSSTTLEWRKNGVVQVSMVLVAGVTYLAVPVNVEMLPTDYLTVATTAAGAGAVGLVVQSRAVGLLS